MDNQDRARLLVKILIGVAWLDNKIQLQESEYLAKVVSSEHLERDEEINALLTGAKSVTSADCEAWIATYLENRSIFDDDRLIEAISSLIYSDGDVATAEAQLLNNIQSTPAVASPSNPRSSLTKIRRLYHRWVDKLSS